MLNSGSSREKTAILELELQDLVNGVKKLQLFIQPIVYFKKKQVYACEILSRGAIGTALADVSPFLYPDTYKTAQKLDRIALKTFFENEKDIPGECFFLNVYLSNLEFLNNCLKDYNFQRKIVVEIDFSTELVDINKIINDINKLRAYKNISFAVDDLGKYSLDKSLYNLIKPEYLKVDICITKGIAEDLIQQKILDDIILLADNIGSTLILEGIELRSDAKYLQSLGLELAQGNLFQRPIEYSKYTRNR